MPGPWSVTRQRTVLVALGSTLTSTARPAWRELLGVGNEIDERLLEAPVVAEDPHRRARRFELDSLLGRVGERRDRGDRGRRQVARVEAAQLELDRACPEARQIENVADHALHAQRVAIDRRQQRPALALVGLMLGILEQADARPNRGQRRPQLVRDGRQQVGPQLLELGQSLGLIAAAEQRVAQSALPDAGDHEATPVLVHAADAHEPERGELVEVSVAAPSASAAPASLSRCSTSRAEAPPPMTASVAIRSGPMSVAVSPG